MNNRKGKSGYQEWGNEKWISGKMDTRGRGGGQNNKGGEKKNLTGTVVLFSSFILSSVHVLNLAQREAYLGD